MILLWRSGPSFVPLFPVDNANSYHTLLSEIAETLQSAKERAFSAINAEIVRTYWAIGRYITEYELNGQEKASYGSHLYKKTGRRFNAENWQGFQSFGLVYDETILRGLPKRPSSVWTIAVEPLYDSFRHFLIGGERVL